MSRKKMLILGDLPGIPSGLAHITRDLAIRINQMPEFEVAVLGTGWLTSKRFDFHQYQITRLDHDMVPMNLKEVWEDFAGSERGIIFTIWNPGWLSWLAKPDILPDSKTKQFLLSNPFERWAYLPVDAEGPNGRLPLEFASIISQFDRPLAYTRWQSDLTNLTLSQPPFLSTRFVDYLPHGIDFSVYYPRDREWARKTLLKTVTGTIDQPIQPDTFLVSIVATNTQRKDWALGFRVCRELLNRGINVGLWAHTDKLKANWDLQTLTTEFGMEGRVIPTDRNLTEEEMAMALSACDVNLGIGLGEGWGLPTCEALACGVPVVAGNYAGSTEFTPKEMLVDPLGFFDEGFYCQQRPVFRVTKWADRIHEIVRLRTGKSLLSDEFSWEKLWPRWRAWLLNAEA